MTILGRYHHPLCRFIYPTSMLLKEYMICYGLYNTQSKPCESIIMRQMLEDLVGIWNAGPIFLILLFSVVTLFTHGRYKSLKDQAHCPRIVGKGWSWQVVSNNTAGIEPDAQRIQDRYIGYRLDGSEYPTNAWIGWSSSTSSFARVGDNLFLFQ